MPLEPSFVKHATTARSDRGYIAKSQAKALAAFYGGDALYPYITKLRPNEDELSLSWRREQVEDHYENYTYECSATYVEQVYRTNQIQRTSGSSVGTGLEDWLRRDYDTWFQNEVAALALVLPECFVYIDPPALNETPASRGEQEALQAWPRPQFVLPSAVVNYGTDDDGNVVWCTRQMSEGDVKFYEIRTPDNVYTVDDTGKPIDKITYASKQVSEAPHGLPNCGVVRLAWRRHHLNGCAGQAFLAQVVAKSFACLRFMGMLVEAGYFHMNYERVVSPETWAHNQKLGPNGNGQDLVEPDSSPDVKVAETRYLDKPSMQMDQLKDLVFNLIPAAIYRAARLRDRTTNQIASGASKMMDAVPEIAALSAVASFLQQADLAIVKTIVRGYDEQLPEDKIEVTYPTRFDLKTGSDILLEIAALADAEAKGAGPTSPTAYIELKYAAMRALLPDLNDKVLTTVWTELNEAPDEAEAVDAGLRGSVGGSAQVLAIQTAFYKGELPRDAAIANLARVFLFSESEAAELIPDEAPDAPKGETPIGATTPLAKLPDATAPKETAFPTPSKVAVPV